MAGNQPFEVDQTAVQSDAFTLYLCTLNVIDCTTQEPIKALIELDVYRKKYGDPESAGAEFKDAQIRCAPCDPV